jgi:GT2 family glycosyltransferase
MDVTVVIPTRDRLAVLRETLARLERQSEDVAFEVVVVDDGSDEDVRKSVRDLARTASLDVTLIEQPPQGPAAARNRGIAAARAPVCLFMNDDSWADAALLTRHRDFHARNPDERAAMLGRLTLPSDPPPSPFMRWLAGVLFDYGSIDDPRDVGGGRFFTANVSAKVDLVRRCGGFDESFPLAAYEDLDLGLRLQQHGMRLAYDAHAVAAHAHPMDLAGAIVRLRRHGHAMAPFVERHPEWPVPRRPGLRHRVKAGVLTGVAAIGIKAPHVQREIWRFLCHEAAREGYWSAVEQPGPARRSPEDRLRIGSRLAQLAIRNEKLA